MEQEKFPESVVIQCEQQQKALELRRIVRTAQDSFARLRDDEQFVMPDKLSDLTIEYCKEFFKLKRQRIEDMVINEDDTTEVQRKRKLLQKNQMHHANCTRSINEVRAFLDDVDLGARFDQLSQNIIPTADLDQLAAERVKRPVPYLAAEEWKLLQDVKSAYKKLREWQQEYDLKKMPLKVLFGMDLQKFLEEWATNNRFVPGDEPTTIKAMREASERTFI